MKRLPCGIQNFESLINDGYLYVDKTAYIRDMMDRGRHYFLARPRRFGKSLLISTIEAYFQGKSYLFEGLAIAEGKTNWKSYPIFHIDLSPEDYQDRSCLENRLNYYLTQWERLYGKTEAAVSLSERFESCIERAFEKTGNRVIILVDEYDKPLLQALEDATLQTQFRQLLKAFYGVIKSKDGRIKFSLLTGITKFSKVSIFSDLNNLTDISRDKRYAYICGLTQTEILHDLSPYTDGLCQEEGMTREQAVEQLQVMYDGYYFVENAQEGIFNPYSVMNALVKSKFGSYWFETGTPNMIARLLQTSGYPLDELTSVPLDAAALDSQDSFGQNMAPLLYQSGYLTIRDFDKISGLYWLDFPNREVRDGFFKYLLPYYTNLRKENCTFVISQFVTDIRDGKTEQFLLRLQSFFADFQYDAQELSEAHYRNVLYVLCKLLSLEVDAEYATSDGRIDILIRTNNYIYVIECKIDQSAQVALKQIKDKQYHLPWALDSRKVIGVGLNFSTQTRRPEEWIIEEITTQKKGQITTQKNGENTTQKKRQNTTQKKRQNTTQKKRQNTTQKKGQNTTQKKGQNTTQKKRPLTPNQKRILNYLKRHPQGSREDIVTALKNISEDGVKYSIGVLKKYHGLHRKGGRKNGEWIFKN